MVLVTLLGGDGHKTRGLGTDLYDERDRDSPTGNQRVLGSTWLPVSDSVMEQGHLEDGYERRGSYYAVFFLLRTGWSLAEPEPSPDMLLQVSP